MAGLEGIPVTLLVTEYAKQLPEQTMAELHAATSGEHMIPLTPERLREHPLGVTVMHGDQVAGYTGVTSEYTLTDVHGQTHRALEVGGAVVVPQFQRRGLASAMLERIINTTRHDPANAPGTRLVAFTNEHSRRYMEAAGMVPLAVGELIAPKAFELCAGCTQCPIAIKPWEDPLACCDFDGIRALVL